MEEQYQLKKNKNKKQQNYDRFWVMIWEEVTDFSWIINEPQSWKLLQHCSLWVTTSIILQMLHTDHTPINHWYQFRCFPSAFTLCKSYGATPMGHEGSQCPEAGFHGKTSAATAKENHKRKQNILRNFTWSTSIHMHTVSVQRVCYSTCEAQNCMLTSQICSSEP